MQVPPAGEHARVHGEGAQAVDQRGRCERGADLGVGRQDPGQGQPGTGQS